MSAFGRSVCRVGPTAAMLAAILAQASPARAQSYGSIVRERYVACREEAAIEPPPPLPPSPKPPLELSPVSQRRAPAVNQIAPLLVIDVAIEEPIPSKKATPAAPSPSVPLEAVVTIEGENDFHCIGVPRGKARILRVVAAGPGARFGGGRNAHSYRRENLLATGMFDLREAIPSLRRELDRPIPSAIEPHAVFERLDEKLSAMRSLADFRDIASTDRVLGYLRSRETTPWSGFWKEALETLARLDPEAAQRYATEVVRAAAKQSKDADFFVRAVLPYMVRPSSDALAALTSLAADTEGPSSRWHDACEILAARIRVGDEALARALRPDLAGNLLTNRATVCYSQVIGLAFRGDDPADVDTLIKRQRYDEMLHFIERARAIEAQGKLDRAWASAKQRLSDWLQKHRLDTGGDRVNGVDVASGKITNGVPVTNAKHLAAMAALGDAAAKRDLDRLIEDPHNTGTGPWIAALLALRFDFEGAADHAANRLRLAALQRTQRFSSDPWPHRGQLVITEHGEVVEALAKRQDPRFALGLLDQDAYTRDFTTQALARDRNPRACEIVARAARQADERAIQHAFWAMSVLEDACRDTMWRLVDDRTEPPAVKGMALEALAMTRDPKVRGIVEPQGRGDEMRPARARAKIIYRARP